MKLLRTLLLLLLTATALDISAQRTFRVVTWNIENAFDTIHDAGYRDLDFLPKGSHRWTSSRYWRKLDEVGKTLVGLGDTVGLPALVGLCEVENDTVLTQLTQRSALRNAGYHYIMTHSPDERGVDVALLYHPGRFRPIAHHSIRVPSVSSGFQPTRDILYVAGRQASGDTLHVMVCHLPSKAGGVRNANKHRNLVARTLRHAVDSLLALSPGARLLVMGDFNATPGESVFKLLLPPLRETLPTSRKALRQPVGTYYFQRLWSYLDHILATPSVRIIGEAHEVRLPHLLDANGHPWRTFKGTYYNGGISDHLPLVVDLEE